jgi:hypothetical protein
MVADDQAARSDRGSLALDRDLVGNGAVDVAAQLAGERAFAPAVTKQRAHPAGGGAMRGTGSRSRGRRDLNCG